ncbi:hypothetical protein [Hahella sp. CCB-MM4]|uniref:hypothetical protein n=1 Tax=Hahella sp. (strain CCB-MM4) TaxID=1926491 RepID=UPI000B9A2BA7|nr:hypothetical protein [Hahella sp. CCB-MM4]
MNRFIAFICFILTSTDLLADPNLKYKYIQDKYGHNLGVEYSAGKYEISGELALAEKDKKILFIECKRKIVLDNEYYMRRTVRNCSNNMAEWPPELVEYVTVSLGTSVTLGGPPSTCGVCTEIPYAKFELPKGVNIDPSIHVLPITPTLEILEALVLEQTNNHDTSSDKDPEDPYHRPFDDKPESGGLNPGGLNPGGLNPGGLNPGGLNPGGFNLGGGL